ncbi:LOW QUALITY PROTEIN: melanoma-associated antigen B5-like [Manis pentadactyla]|uniref:LOW QUALITY PROTEIN: melanoma-associated antigen B5-like n=1 Tax=Manis pentadactyla TaxID=143292 RepID=UPI00255C892E|nr:LOW QUALITY PROTEIN: melanoma-associated antigen B5-like [Manis pentadactyla]
MPQRRKSKRQGRQTQHQAQGETQSRGQAQATAAAAAAAAEPTPSSFPQCEDLIQSLPDVEPRSTGQQPQEAPPVTTASTHTTSDEASDDEDQDRPRIPEVPLNTEGSDKGYLVKNSVDLLGYFLVQRYELKQPILKEDMLMIIGKENEYQFPEILKKTAKHIEILFALDLKESDSPRPSYDLVSKLKLPNNGRVRPGRGYPKTGLLMHVLGIILLHNNCATEEDMWKHLSVFSLYPGRRHFLFGEPRKLITQDLVRLKYLECRQVPGSGPPLYVFLWGPKAHAETSRMKILEFIVNTKREFPSAFPFFCEEALQDEEEKAKVTTAVNLGTTGRVCIPSRAMSRSIFPPLLMTENFCPPDQIHDRITIAVIFLEMQKNPIGK